MFFFFFVSIFSLTPLVRVHTTTVSGVVHNRVVCSYLYLAFHLCSLVARQRAVSPSPALCTTLRLGQELSSSCARRLQTVYMPYRCALPPCRISVASSTHKQTNRFWCAKAAGRSGRARRQEVPRLSTPACTTSPARSRPACASRGGERSRSPCRLCSMSSCQGQTAAAMYKTG